MKVLPANSGLFCSLLQRSFLKQLIGLRGNEPCSGNTTCCFTRVFFASLSEKTKVEVIQGDITDYGRVLEASRGAHVIVHMASLVDVWHKIPDSLIYSVNIKGEAPAGLVGVRDGEETPVYQRLHLGNHKPEEITSCLEDFKF